MQKAHFFTIYTDIVSFEKIYEHRLQRLTLQNKELYIPNEDFSSFEFIRVKTDYNKDFYFDFLLFKTFTEKLTTTIYLGKRIDFYVEGKRWSKKNSNEL